MHRYAGEAASSAGAIEKSDEDHGLLLASESVAADGDNIVKAAGSSARIQSIVTGSSVFEEWEFETRGASECTVPWAARGATLANSLRLQAAHHKQTSSFRPHLFDIHLHTTSSKMDMSPDLGRQSPSGPRHLQSPPRPQIPHPSSPSEVALSSDARAYPEMVQTSYKSALLPTVHAQSRRRAVEPRHITRQTAHAPDSGIVTNHHQTSSSAQSRANFSYTSPRHYPHAPPPARHRSRSPADNPPATYFENQPTASHHSHDPAASSSPRQEHKREALRPTAPAHSAHVYHHVQRARNPYRLLPTTVRAPRGFAFELAPADNEFIYTPPRTTNDDTISSGQGNPPPFRPVLRPLSGTVREVAPDHLGLVFTDLVDFDDSRRMLEDTPDDPNLRQRYAQGFVYESGVDYQSVQEDIPSSPPVLDEFMWFEAGRMEASERCSTIRPVSEDDYADFSQCEMPGMWP